MTGGYIRGYITNEVFGLKFTTEEVNSITEYNANVTGFVLPLLKQRAFHQSVIVQNADGAQTLFAIGGKSERSTWETSVESLDLTPTLWPGQSKQIGGKIVKNEADWQFKASMNCARSNFAVLPMFNFIYVFGGIQG